MTHNLAGFMFIIIGEIPINTVKWLDFFAVPLKMNSLGRKNNWLYVRSTHAPWLVIVISIVIAIAIVIVSPCVYLY